jgi:hypothetical protein
MATWHPTLCYQIWRSLRLFREATRSPIYLFFRLLTHRKIHRYSAHRFILIVDRPFRQLQHRRNTLILNEIVKIGSYWAQWPLALPSSPLSSCEHPRLEQRNNSIRMLGNELVCVYNKKSCGRISLVSRPLIVCSTPLLCHT